MKTGRHSIRTLQLLFFVSVTCTGTSFAQRERILWSKPDADPLLDVVFSNDGTIVALGREDSNTTDLLNAADGSIAFSPSGRVLAAVYGSSNTAGAIQFWRVKDWSSIAIFAKPNHVHDIAFLPQPGVFAYTIYSGGVTVSSARFIK